MVRWRSIAAALCDVTIIDCNLTTSTSLTKMVYTIVVHLQSKPVSVALRQQLT